MGTSQYLQGFSPFPRQKREWEHGNKKAAFVPIPGGWEQWELKMGTAQRVRIQAFTNIVPIVPIVHTKKQPELRMKKDFFAKLLETPVPTAARQAVPIPEPKPVTDPVEGAESFNQYGENCETHDSALFGGGTHDKLQL